MENKPNCSDIIDKYISLNKNKLRSKENTNQNIENKNDINQVINGMIINNNKTDKNIISNNKSDLNESKLLNNKNDNLKDNNTNILNNSGSILNDNIFNNKLLLSFKQKEKNLKCFESYQDSKKENHSNKKNNNINNFTNNNSPKLNSSEKEIENKDKDKSDINVRIRNEYGDLFKLNNITSDRKINTIKSDNDLTIWKENESNFYKEKKEEENTINEELRERFRLKEVVLKFILTDEEYSLLVQEKAKSINPFRD